MIRSYEGRILEHTALNCLLQGSGSIVVKKWLLLCQDEVSRRGLDSVQVIFYHDEKQADTLLEHSEEVGEVDRLMMVASGEHFKLRLPLKADVHIGRNWAETH